MIRKDFLKNGLGLLSSILFTNKKSKSLVTTNAINNDVFVQNIKSLKTKVPINGSDNYVIVLGYYEPGDGGEGLFIWDPRSVEADDGGITFIPTMSGFNSTGRWKRIINSNFLDAKWFGANPSLPDNSKQIQAALDYLENGSKNEDFVGGGIHFSTGIYNVKSSLVINALSHIRGCNITFEGDGMLSTIIRAARDWTGNAVISCNESSYCVFKNLTIDGNKIASRGIEFLGVQSGHRGYNELTLENVKVTLVNGDGFYFESGFLINLTKCLAYQNAGVGFHLLGFHTSTSLRNCYANQNGMQGYILSNLTYTALYNCASDKNKIGYFITNADSLTFYTCGAESNDQAAWHFEASNSLDVQSHVKIKGIRNVYLSNCIAIANDPSNLGYGNIYTNQVDNSRLYITANSFNEMGRLSSKSVVSAGSHRNHKITLISCNFLNPITSDVAVVGSNNAIRTSGIKVLSNNIPICKIFNSYGTTESYTGLLYVVANSDQYSYDSNSQTSSYLINITKTNSLNSVNMISAIGNTSGEKKNDPSFKFNIDSDTNTLTVSPVGLTRGIFYFLIEANNSLKVNDY